MDVTALSPSTLAFVGDAYYGLLVRDMLAEINRPVGELHASSVKLVKAGAQAQAFEAVAPFLTEKELAVYKRGRNTHVNTVPKNATVAEYHSATGVEALFGYLHLSGEDERAKELFSIIIEAINGKTISE